MASSGSLSRSSVPTDPSSCCHPSVPPWRPRRARQTAADGRHRPADEHDRRVGRGPGPLGQGLGQVEVARPVQHHAQRALRRRARASGSTVRSKLGSPRFGRGDQQPPLERSSSSHDRHPTSAPGACGGRSRRRPGPGRPAGGGRRAGGPPGRRGRGRPSRRPPRPAWPAPSGAHGGGAGPAGSRARRSRRRCRGSPGAGWPRRPSLKETTNRGAGVSRSGPASL